MQVLRINDVPGRPPAGIAEGAGWRRVEVSWQDGAARRVAVSEFAYQVGSQDSEQIRWYLEDYAEFRADPAPRLAAGAEARLERIGADLFGRVFGGQDAGGIWALARDGLGGVRVEVDADPAEVPGLPWELLRDPGTGGSAALGAAAFVRTHLRAAAHPALPEPGGDRLRVLLVICRPGRGDDVPFRSVASRLVRGGAGQMQGLKLDVLRPATFARLSKALHEAADAGRPYHVVHFDGHGAYLDVTDLEPPEPTEGSETAAGSGGVVVSPLRYGISVAGPVRGGQHGYLLFEDPASPANQQLADGPTLGRLLTAARVPVLVLNACRSAYAEAPDHPDAGLAGEQGEAVSPAGLQADVHARIRAYGSLAAEVADAGVPGVVAMRYNVYVVTAAQFAANLYAHLLAGRSLGEAAAAARRALAADPARRIGAAPVALQDWAVPVIYEAAPLALLQPASQAAPLITLTPSDAPEIDQAGGGIPRPPDAGFFGRDETLLALDRAFDTQQVVLLHGYAGAGKSATAAEFARWYAVTGGLDQPGHPDVESGPVIWSSFEQHLPLERLLNAAGDRFAGLLEASGIHWQAVTGTGRRRELVLQVLAQVPALWVWENVEPVTGFPADTPSTWTPAEQDELADFLRDLAQRTCCKVLLTSRREEGKWLGGLPARVSLPPMPMRERLQLAAAIAARRGHLAAGADWRPLLRYTDGNPLTITVLVGQALDENLSTTADIEAFISRLRAGEAELEPGQDEALGRTKSLAASLGYGFARAFTRAQRDQLALLHLFRGTADVDALRFMGTPKITGDYAVPQLSDLTREVGIALLDQAADIGLLTPLGGGHYAIHPALPWYFAAMFTTAYGKPGQPGTTHPARAYACALGHLCRKYTDLVKGEDAVTALSIEEDNIRHALTIALTGQQWNTAVDCVQGLSLLYRRTGREGERARLVERVAPYFTDPATDGPPPGREEHWALITHERVQVARNAQDWPAAARLQRAEITWDRDNASAALAAPDAELTRPQRNQLRNLALSLDNLGDILRLQEDPGCLAHYEEALSLYQRIGDQREEAATASGLGNAYEQIPGLRDLDQAEQWYRHSLELLASHDADRAYCLANLGSIYIRRFDDARNDAADKAVLLEYLNAALRYHRQALDLRPASDPQGLADSHNHLGAIYRRAGDTRQALHHYQQSIKHEEDCGNVYGTGQTRLDVAVLLAGDGRRGDALHYARAALHDLQRVGPAAVGDIAKAQQVITILEQQGP